MKHSALIAGLGLLVLGSGTAYAQGAPAMPGPIGPDSNAAASSGREQTQAFTHVMNNLDRGQPVATKGAVRKVTAAEITPGAPLRDIDGKPVGKIDSVDADGVVVDTGQYKVRVPLVSFGKDSSGLVLGTTAAKFNEVAAKAHAQALASAPPAKPEPRPATVADITAGAQLRDINGQPVGKITAVSADGATLDTGKTKVKLPLDAFGVDPTTGLMIGITTEKLNEIIAQADAAAGKKN
jgi:preprotein translocase subunit YajC